VTGVQAWSFVLAAYAVSVSATLALAGWSLLSMRRAEARARAIDRR
jgi:hypothetical protein